MGLSSEESKVCKKAIEIYGADVQQIMAMEEMGELIQAISKKIRGFDHQANIPEEIADVEIMLEQLKHIHKCHQSVNYWRRKKIMRLAGYIEGERFKGQNSERRI